jgi:hypothetical protein
MAWFRSLSGQATEAQTEYGYALHFRDFGPIAYQSDGSINADLSPVVTIVLPQTRRGTLWTIGEIHFRATPLRKQFPLLHKLNSDLSKWLSALECVYSHKRRENLYSYYLEGSAQNGDADIFAFRSGLEGLSRGQYFVSYLDNAARLDAICKALRLRGVHCADA